MKKRQDYLYWKARKRLAVEYQHAMWKLFPSYVKAQARKRVGNCDGCGFKWLCCLGCSHFDEQAEKCRIYETRPMGCRMFMMDRFQAWMMCGDGCQRWPQTGGGGVMANTSCFQQEVRGSSPLSRIR